MSAARRVAARLDDVSLSLIRQVFEKAPAGAINLGLGEPVFDTAPEILAAARRALDGGRLGYTFNGGRAELRARIAEISPNCAGPECVCVTVGANGGLLGAMMASVDPGDEVLVPDPGFPTYEALAKLAGAHPVRYPMRADDGFRFRAETLLPLINDATRVVVINSPSNPTGQTIAREQLAALAHIAAQHDLVVIADEVYHEFWFDQPCTSYAEVADHGLVVNSLSKTEAMTGWRIGWVTGPAEFIAAITAINQHSVTCAPALAQSAALAALADGRAARVARIREDFAARRRLMLDCIDADIGLPRTEPEGSFFVLLDSGRDIDSLALALDILEKTGVVTVPGAAFGDRAARFLRLSFAASEAEIRAGIDRLGEYF